MRFLLYWGLCAAALVCLFASVTTLFSDVEEQPTRIEAVRFRTDVGETKWVDLQGARFVWKDAIISYKKKDGKPNAEAVTSRDTVYFVPIIALVDSAFMTKLKPEKVLAIAKINGEDAARQFDLEAVMTGKRPLKAEPCVGLRRLYRTLPKNTRSLLDQRLPGLDGVDVLAIGDKPFQKAEARTTLFVGVGLLALWLFWRKRRKGPGGQPGAAPGMNRYFIAMFSLMGKMAKADGHVSPAEIKVVEEFMTANGMETGPRKQAIEIFNHAKDDGRGIEVYARELAKLEPEVGMRQTAYRILFAIATADGNFEDAERRVLESLVGPLALPPDTFETVRQQFMGDTKPLRECYATVGCSESATDEEVKAAYREKMRKFHPDKIQGKDLADEFVEYAKEQTQALQQAYEAIMKSRGR